MSHWVQIGQELLRVISEPGNATLERITPLPLPAEIFAEAISPKQLVFVVMTIGFVLVAIPMAIKFSWMDRVCIAGNGVMLLLSAGACDRIAGSGQAFPNSFDGIG